MKTIFKRSLKVLQFILLLVLALVGGFGMIVRRPEQDYDNEVKTELVEGIENEMAEEKN